MIGRIGTVVAALMLIVVTFALTLSAEPAPAKNPPGWDKSAVPASGPGARPDGTRGEGYPVTLDGKAMFYLQHGYGAYTAEERARAVSKRIQKLAEDPYFNIESITVADDAVSTDIMAGDRVIISINDNDGSGAGQTRQELGKDCMRKLVKAMEGHRQTFSRKGIIEGLIFAVIATLALLGLLFLFKRLYLKASEAIFARVDGRIHSIRIQSFEIVRAERIRTIFTAFVRTLRFVIVIVLLYVYLHGMLSFFPWTRPFAGTLLHYVMWPLMTMGKKILAEMPNLFFIAVLVFITHYVLRLMRLFFAEVEKGALAISGFYPEWAQQTYKLGRILVVAFAAIVAFPYIPGSDSPAFKGVSIFLGVLFSIGSSSAIANVIAGLTMTYRRAFKEGDFIKVGDVAGRVTAIRLQVTHLKTPKNEEVIIPNSTLVNSNVVNFSSEAREKGLILHTSITIGYDAAWRKVHELLVSAGLATEKILKEPAPFVLQTALNDFYVSYELNAYTDAPTEMPRIYSELHQNIQDKFNEAGVEIMSPHYSQLRDGNHTTIPQAYLPQDYTATGLRLTTVDREADPR